ncbi:response regulator transcription factor [Kribbella antibiotica]|uniref:Response regulator transcription factor n=1 Tax=Kribbella antibiotica TaxID=190195 RepID=A0A4R4ZR69_9ACTN|nr:LuxR C-terminal-related transcriptional regulator [Kribbella antibiotica]TDD61453.1 response regulator transcription factor [Kribbella antibiotica]
MRPIQVLIRASDPIVRAGIGAMLSTCAEIAVEASGPADVIVLAERTVGAGRLHALNEHRPARCVVVTDRFDSGSVLLAVQLGVKSVVPAASATAALLVAAVTGATRGISLMPPDLQAALLRELDQMLQANGLSMALLDSREREVLSSVADGLNVVEIAARIGCPDRSVRNTLRGVLDRLHLNNPSHAVAYAFRSGALPVPIGHAAR